MRENDFDIDALIVGAGFAGLRMLYSLGQLKISAVAIEAGSGVGGTWYWNRYPGARCDVESMEYSYKFSEELQKEWVWSEKYATQPEILRYIEHVADRFDLRKSVIFDTRVTSASYEESSKSWRIRTDTGRKITAKYLIMATGCLSVMTKPTLPEQDHFKGQLYYTGQWPHDGVDFSGKRVGVIGTGSSGIQCIPVIAQQARELTVFQRSPGYCVPARNGPLNEADVQAIKSNLAAFRAKNEAFAFAFDVGEALPSAKETTAKERQQVFEAVWEKGGLRFLGTFADLITDEESNYLAAEFIRNKIAETVVNPRVAQKLMPSAAVGCKRLCLDTNYYATYNRPNVHLIDISETPITRFKENGIQTADNFVPLDCVVFATGFDAMTGAIDRVQIRGRNGEVLRKKWSEGARTYLGVATAGFPNLFMITGPGSPSVLTNMVVSIEQHVEFISKCIDFMRTERLSTIDAEVEAETAWVDHVNEVAQGTLYPGCNSWYLGANVPGKPRIFLPLLGFPAYAAKCEEVASRGYEGFSLQP